MLATHQYTVTVGRCIVSIQKKKNMQAKNNKIREKEINREMKIKAKHLLVNQLSVFFIHF